jgi:hypothetical protein
LIRYLDHTKINKAKWDETITASSGALVYAMSWYLDIVSPGWNALIDDDYISVFPITHRKKFFISYLHQPHFTQQLGLFGHQEQNENKLADFLNNIPSQFKLVEIQLNHINHLPLTNAFKSFPRRTFHLPLNEDHTEIKKKYSENHTRNINKAIKSGVKISSEINFTEIISLFRKNKGSGISTLQDKDYHVLNLLYENAVKKNLLECMGIYDGKDELIAGAVFLRSLRSHIFHFSATNAKGREIPAMPFIIDTFIKDHSRENFFLDFEGSMDENLARFYRGFGSQEVVYLQIRKNNLPPIIRWLK